jgi:hypothetical protein
VVEDEKSHLDKVEFFGQAYALVLLLQLVATLN